MRADEQMLLELWQLDPIEMPTHEIAKRLRLSESGVHFMRRRLGLPARRKYSPRKGTTQVDVAEFRRLWAMPPTQMPSTKIAAAFGVSVSTVSNLRRSLGLPERERVSACRGRIKVKVDVPLLFKLWAMPVDKMPPAKICSELGVSQASLYTLRQRYKLPARQKSLDRAPDDPTPEEIEARAAEVRASWPDGEHERRSCGKSGRRHWVPPAFSFNGRDAKFDRVSVGI
jgi:hypothetical protein